jgi:putative hydrolase of the HAD superfamily
VPRGILFDFSGTLFHIESAEEAVRAALGPDLASHAGELTRLGAINGSGPPADLPAHLAQVWAARDLSAAAHRAAYSGSARHAGLTAEQAHELYERGISPDAWTPYPDTGEVLDRLRRAGIPVAIVSNIGWDPRPVFARWGVSDLFAALVLSYERGVIKPDPQVFLIACAELGVRPQDALMIGDNPEADGAAAAVGCRFVLVPSDPAQRRADALLRAVGLPPIA